MSITPLVFSFILSASIKVSHYTMKFNKRKISIFFLSDASNSKKEVRTLRVTNRKEENINVKDARISLNKYYNQPAFK